MKALRISGPLLSNWWESSRADQGDSHIPLHGPDHPPPTSVYKFFDDQRRLLYVGITRQGVARQRQHNDDKEWWNFVREQEVEHFESREDAHAREVELISVYAPPFNVQHNPHHRVLRKVYLDGGNKTGRKKLTIRQLAATGAKRSLVLSAGIAALDGTQQLISHPEDYAIIEALSFCDTHVHDNCGRTIGTAVDLVKNGEVGRFSVRMFNPVSVLSHGELKIRFVTLKYPQAVEVKRIIVWLKKS